MQNNHQRRKNPWVISRKITQALSLLGFILTIIFTGLDRLPYSFASFPIRLSPLAMLSSLLSSRIFLGGMTISLLLLISSLVFGRAWCGWLCPLGTLLDIFKFRKKNGQKAISEKLRSIKYILLLVILISAVFSNLTLLVFDPLTIFSRTMTLTILPALDKVITAFERLLVSIPFMTNAVYHFDQWIRPGILPTQPVVFQYALLTGFFFLLIILLNFAAERFWCRYLCPLGALLGIFSKLAIFKRKVNDNCRSCRLCQTRCPTDTIDPQRDFASDPSECTMCMNCLEGCQKGSINFSPRFDLAKWREYDPGKRTFLNSLLVSATLTALLSIDLTRLFPRSHNLRPPGVEDELFSEKCIRCGLCMKVCPTSGLQVDIDQSGIEAASTPILVPRLGFCQYSCNACGQICPVQAIPSLPLAEKQTMVIGKAYINQDRCIAWGDHQTCIVCEEMCPLPQKAITLEGAVFTKSDGQKIILSLPVVNRDTCIGCGICENKCPVTGEAAIRVFIA